MTWTDTDHDYNPEIEQMIEDRLFASEEATYLALIDLSDDLYEGGGK